MSKAGKKQPSVTLFRTWFSAEGGSASGRGSASLPAWATAILAKHGAEIFVVGGAVRDALMGREGKRDLDLVVRGVPLAVLERLLARSGKVDAVGRTFGVLKFVPRGSSGKDAIDIALPRTDFSFGTGGYKDVETRSRHTLPLEKDLARRDFTVNAMAWDVRTGALVDPFGGERDLSKRVLRAVGDPATRFREDYTRVLRLLRFTVELGFTIHPATAAAAKALVPHLTDRRAKQWVVPRELVAKELSKAFAADPLEAFMLADRFGVWRALVPEIDAMKRVPQPRQYHTEGDVFEHTRLALVALMSTPFAKKFPDGWDAETALAVLFHDIGKPPTLKTPEKHGVDRIRFDGHDRQGARMTRSIADRLALSSHKAPRIDISPDRLEWVVAHHLLMVSADIQELRPQTIEKYFLSDKNPGDMLRKVMFCDVAATINQDGKPFWDSFTALEKRIAKIASLRTRTGVMPAALLDGNAIIRATGIKAGPDIGRLIALLRDAQLAGRVRTKTDAIRFVKARA